MELRQHCAYNLTRNCFLSLDVFAGDYSFAILSDWMAKLTPGSGAGLWLVPFRGIRAPDLPLLLDLVYLDEESRVVAVVEKFPSFCVSPSSPTATSVLALPTGLISSTGTQPGDELMICTGEEMRWHVETSSRASAISETEPSAVFSEQESSAYPGSDLLQAENPLQERHVESQEVYQRGPVKSLKDQSRAKRSWLERWLFPEPSDRDKRATARNLSPSVTAHFWTGGAPQAHRIRDISPTGLYVVTQERWYLGTQIRITLAKTCAGDPSIESSITVQAIAVRWGNDGVGLEFVLNDPRNLRRGRTLLSDSGNSEQLQRFLERVKGDNDECPGK